MDSRRNSSLRLRPRMYPGADASSPESADLESLHTRVVNGRGDVSAALDIARDLGAAAPHPGQGVTASLWEHLATIAVADVQAARVVEPHLDAVAILAQATRNGIDMDLGAIGTSVADDRHATWGVFAAEGANTRLVAAESPSGFRLTGRKPWCSLASRLSHALVTACTASGARALFAVDLRGQGITTHDELWRASGMAQVPSAHVDFDGVDAVRIGVDGWYLERPGFWWGGLGVAAIWWGGAVGIARSMRSAVAAHREPDQLAFAHLGMVDARLEAARAVLADAADRIDAPFRTGSGSLTIDDFRLLAARGRAVAAEAVEAALSHSARSLGAAPFALDADFARQHAGLALYVRQHHAERDDAALGRILIASEKRGTTTW